MRKFVTPEFIIGMDARRLAGQYLKNFGARNVLVVTGPNIIKAGWTRDVTDSLRAENIRYTLFSHVSPNPRESEVMEGASLYERSGCDAIVVAGGGSPIDCAKGIGIVSSNKRHILEFEGVDNVAIPSPPLICIPTTGGTGADVSQFAIIKDTKRSVKIAIISKKIVPDIALIDPVPLTSLTPDLTAHTGMDALSHGIEAYVSNASSPVTDIHALESIRIMYTNLVSAFNNPESLEYRYQTMLGSLLAGLAFSNASLGAVHAMAHSLGGLSDLPHGECNTLLLEHVIAFNYDSCPERYKMIGRGMGVDLPASNHDARDKIISALRTLKESLGLAHTLREAGITEGDIPGLAEKAMQDPCMVTNPRKPTLEDIRKIYYDAL